MVNILVTGSSGGIGRAIAAALRERVAVVVGHATRAVDADTIAADFTDPMGPQMLWQAALERLGGRVDVLVNNAGLFSAVPLDASDIGWLDAWEDTLRINLTAAAQLSRFAVRHWQERGSKGRIVHIATYQPCWAGSECSLLAVPGSKVAARARAVSQAISPSPAMTKSSVSALISAAPPRSSACGPRLRGAPPRGYRRAPR